MKALTVEELREMAGQPVWCPEEDAYGIVMCDKHGKWAGIPFLQGVWQQDEVGVEFNHNIIGRKLKCYRIEDKKEVPMELVPKIDDYGTGKWCVRAAEKRRCLIRSDHRQKRTRTAPGVDRN